jgi:hypothetical protein
MSAEIDSCFVHHPMYYEGCVDCAKARRLTFLERRVKELEELVTRLEREVVDSRLRRPKRLA